METHIPSNTSRPSRTLEAILYSKQAAFASSIISALLVLMALVLIGGGKSIGESAPLASVAAVSVVATVMLWLHNRYAVYTWAFVAGLTAVVAIVLAKWDQHNFLYWGERISCSLVSGAIALWLFRIARRLMRRSG